ncbi:MAG: hypothetical protein ACRCWR_00990 [Saezia sp.]
MNQDEKIAAMFALAEKQQYAVSLLIKSLANTSKNVQKEAREAIKEQTKESIAKLSTDAQEALNASVEPFKKQMQELESTTRKINEHMVLVSDRLSVKVFVLVCLACVMCVLATVGTSYWFAKDVASLRTEHRQLQANIKALEDAGGKIYIGDCDGQICVRVDPDKGHYTQNSTGLPMYLVR